MIGLVGGSRAPRPDSQPCRAPLRVWPHPTGTLLAWAAVSTRRLIVAALLTGMAILVAGSIFLFRVGDQQDRLGNPTATLPTTTTTTR